MNSSQIHLALTHVPVILSIVGLAILIIASVSKNSSLIKNSFYILFVAALFVIPVYLTGEGAEEIAEKLPGVSEDIINRHEKFANISLAIILTCGVVSLAGLLLYNRLSSPKAIQSIILILALGSALAMARTAHLGGQIRHTEIRPAYVSDKATESQKQSDGENSPNKADDD